MGVRVFHRDEPSGRLGMIASDARLVIWPGVGAWDANMNFVVMEPGEENRPHVHPESEDAIYILEGRGTVRDLTNDVVLEFEAGQVIFVPAGVEHQVRGDRGVGVVSAGGPCPADLEMLRRAGAEVPERPAQA
jgi:quercetin dioxygenase-like cupin family protein